MIVEITGVQDGAEEQRVAEHEYDKWLANYQYWNCRQHRLQSTFPRFVTDTSSRSRMSQQPLPHVR